MKRNPLSYQQSFRELQELHARHERDQRWGLAAMIALAVCVIAGAFL